jgi:inosine/xanthosine triphosphatase
MIIAVGSLNKTKLAAVQRAIYGDGPREPCYPAFLEDEIRGYNVSSMVREQPFTPEETVRGAINRATEAFARAREENECRFGVGIEAGLLEMLLLTYPDGTPRYEERTYCFIHDGSRYFFGSSAGFEHPKAIIDCVLKEGVDISEAYRRCKFTDSPKIGEEKGCVNVLTKGRVTREQEIADTVRRALIACENKMWYEV